MKKIVALGLAFMIAGSLAACGGSGAASTTKAAAAAATTKTTAATTAAAAATTKAAADATTAKTAASTGGKKELKWATVHPETAIGAKMMAKAIDEINSKAEGIHVTGFYNGTMGGSSDVVEGVQEGLVDIINEGPAQFQSWIPKAAQVEAPYLWKDVDHMVNALNGGYKDTLNKEFDKVNVRILGSFYYGTRQLTTNKEIKTLADLKGMKIRVPETDLYVKMIQSWGAAAAPMNINELYMALQTGTVDGQENPLPTYESHKFYEVSKNVTLTNHIICPNMVFINGTTWKGLSDKDKKVVQDAVDAAIKWNNQAVLDSEKDLQKTLAEKYGVKFTTPDDTIRDATIPAIKPLIEDWDVLQTMTK